MKILVKNSIKGKIDEYIDEANDKGLEIARIELSQKEFRELLNNLGETCLDDIGSTVKKFPNVIFEWFGHFEIRSGSYLMYRGICVQCHRGYGTGNFGFEYI